MAKIVGSIMTIVFSLVAFAHGQSCQLLPGWTPSTLADGRSRTGYQIPDATYTQSCPSAFGMITCISGVIINNGGNIFKYPSCTPHTWANCTTPTTANHLDYKTLYKSATNTYTETCQQLSQSLQCLNAVFTGGTTPGLYTFATCVDTTRAQCIDTRTNPDSFRDHGETLVGYTSNTPGLGQTCATIQKTLTCTNGNWLGNGPAGQAGLFTGCNPPSAYLGCANVRNNNSIVPHSSSVDAYTSPISLGAGICADVAHPLTCVNGIRSGGTQASLYSGCVQANTNSCSKSSIGMGTGIVLHGAFVTKYTQAIALSANNDYCNDANHMVTLQCVNGSRSGNTSAAYTGCQNVAPGACFSAGVYTPNFQFVIMYSIPSATVTQSCQQSQQQYSCLNGVRSGGLAPSGNTTCNDCTLPRGGILTEGNTTYGFSISGDVEYPKSCNDYTAALMCSGGILNGNWQTYKYPVSQCNSIGGLVPGMDVSINESAVRNGYPIAQGSSPEIAILFKNRGNVTVNKSNLPAGFLKCIRNEKNMNIYSSNVLSSFVLNAGTKVGINIRINPIFTQAVGTKTIKCEIYPSAVGISTDHTDNNVWSGTFEIMKADRFDLALSTSIESISKNLEAAEGAKGAQGVQNFLYNKIMNVLVPLIIIIGILSAILGFYKIMFSSDDNATKEGTNYIIYGVIGIILIMSAKFIGQNVFDLLTSQTGIQGSTMAVGLYDRILYPFIKLAIYLVLGAMFVILVTRVITFLFGSDADAQKKAGTLIGWNVLSMLIIIGAKQIVEAIYGKQAVVTNQNITNLGEIGSGVLADKNIPILYQVINYALGIASLVILVIIIIQTVKLLTKPDDPAQIKSIKNSLLYMFIGILILGTGYLIVNFAIIN
ncbi:MAG: hypothetical protein WC010_03875 [Candidatus Absconditabacterales bacterium]